MAQPKLTPRATPNARVDEIERGWRLSIPAGNADKYRFAQIDDYFGLKRKDFPHHSLTLSLRARTSAFPLSGTWGFGLWNDPFGMSLGFGGNKFRLPTLPNAAWFFGASKENYLSFQYDNPANGFIAQSFRSPKFHPYLILAGLAFPFRKTQTRRYLSKAIAEDSFALSVNPTQWRSYQLEWSPKRVVWKVDNVQAFESSVSPNPPLGLVIWIDNQFASFTPDGKLAFGTLANDEAWLEIADLEISNKQ